MSTSGTNVKEVTKDRLVSALTRLHDLQKWLVTVEDVLDAAIKVNDGRAFPIHWAEVINEKALGIHNEIARCNGAALVRKTR